MDLIEMAERVRVAHLKAFNEKLCTGVQLAIAKKIIDGEEVPEYLSKLSRT